MLKVVTSYVLNIKCDGVESYPSCALNTLSSFTSPPPRLSTSCLVPSLLVHVYHRHSKAGGATNQNRGGAVGRCGPPPSHT